MNVYDAKKLDKNNAMDNFSMKVGQEFKSQSSNFQQGPDPEKCKRRHQLPGLLNPIQPRRFPQDSERTVSDHQQIRDVTLSYTWIRE